MYLKDIFSCVGNFIDKQKNLEKLKTDNKNISEINTRLSSAEATWQMAENLYRQLADQVRENSYDIKDINRDLNN